jgi:hypothetical protein
MTHDSKGKVKRKVQRREKGPHGVKDRATEKDVAALASLI